MSSYINFLNDIINKSKSQYPDYSNQIKWVGYKDASEKGEEKKQILDQLENKLNWSFKNTKPWINSLSKGCQLCGKGEWSCIFITGNCNANCFYCPTLQKNDGIPSSQLTSFDNVDDYIHYLDYFGFKGASLSGGEPLIVFERTLHYIAEIKKFFGEKLYLWMYTNGILGSIENYKKLAKAGIDEIRFDIGATNYNLKYIKLAQGIISNITVEIPAVPEEFEKLKQIIPELIEIGVTNLNLHQMRLTNYNAPKLLKRKYTYLHGEQATVLESELTALKIIEFVANNNLNIGVNYCAFNFKNRFQKAGFRRKISSKFMESHEFLTENGYLRSITKNGLLFSFKKNQLVSENKETANKTKNLEIKYKGFILDDHAENTQYIKKLIIGNKPYFLRTGFTQKNTIIDSEKVADLISLLQTNGDVIPEENDLFSIWKNEFIEWNLREYF